MGYKCDVCENEEGVVFCFADEAVLCRQCDNSVHGNAKSAEKHERVGLTASTSTHQCDICQEQNAALFCAEDRTLLCRRCDLMIHKANAQTAKHHRTLLIGMNVGLEALPLPGETGRTEEGTSRRLRRNNTYGSASASGSHGTTAAPSRRAAAHAQPQSPTKDSIPHAPSSGNLINTGAHGALISPFDSAGSYLPFSDPVASTNAMGMPGPSNADAGAAAGPGAGAYEPAAPWLDAPGGMTLAAELLGVPSVSNGFTAKDIDAAYMLGGTSGELQLEAGLSALLEVPDFDSNSPSCDDMFAGYNPGPLPGMHKHKQPAGDGVVPDLFQPASKRQRA
ncbi:hypothetical protein WJX73_010120 [Symbiochloris irregularis]|uniref:B box-type domain-containing protein n=1 Tax=Symbiochloris irregularis TaxID=706552 RepID=A0AAW1NPP5_9CHLO